MCQVESLPYSSITPSPACEAHGILCQLQHFQRYISALSIGTDQTRWSRQRMTPNPETCRELENDETEEILEGDEYKRRPRIDRKMRFESRSWWRKFCGEGKSGPWTIGVKNEAKGTHPSKPNFHLVMNPQQVTKASSDSSKRSDRSIAQEQYFSAVGGSISTWWAKLIANQGKQDRTSR